MATKNYVPRADGEGEIGTAAKNWLKGWFKSIFISNNIGRSAQVGITAFATGGQASAVAIVADIAEISVCATGGDSVKLPTAVAGLVIKITNQGAAASDIFPNTDDAINEAAANTAKSLGVDASMLCIAYDATNWECLTLAR